jgi:hypothetical protein
MNDENRKNLWRLIQLTGDYLINKLPNHPNHPNGRNPYAHVALKIKNHYGLSYKDLPDDKLEDVRLFLDNIKKEEG